MSRPAIDLALDAIIAPASDPLRPVILYAVQGGKRVRGLLLLAAGAENRSNPEALTCAAASVELLHAATLVQDDIFDRSRLRRGAPSVHCVFGHPLATLASDWMMAAAIRAAYRLHGGFGEALSLCAERLIEGEALEMQVPALRTHAALRMRAEAIARGKTGELFGLSLSAPALLSGKDRLAGRLHQAGCILGAAFQYLDDALDLYGEQTVAGKDVGRDLAASLCTLPMLDAAGLLPQSGAATLLGCAGSPPAGALRALQAPWIREHVLTCAHARWQAAFQEVIAELPNAAEAASLLQALMAAVLPQSVSSDALTAA